MTSTQAIGEAIMAASATIRANRQGRDIEGWKCSIHTATQCLWSVAGHEEWPEAFRARATRHLKELGLVTIGVAE